MSHSNFWMMTYGDELFEALKSLPPSDERYMYLRAYGRMGEYLKNKDEQFIKSITFGRYYRLIEPLRENIR